MIAVCTGCEKVIYPGPYFVRRIMRHLNDGHHNHDAMELIPKTGKNAPQRELWYKTEDEALFGVDPETAPASSPNTPVEAKAGERTNQAVEEETK